MADRDASTADERAIGAADERAVGAPGERAAGAADGPPIRVADAPEARRYEAYLGESLAGFADYRLTPGRITFIHTVVDPAFEGRGVGSALAQGALADVRARGLAVIPICPFFKAFIRRHPEVTDLVLPGSGG